MNFNKIKTGDKLVDRWYSYQQNSFGISGKAKVIKVSRKKKTLTVKFENGKEVVYDKEHTEEFLTPYSLKLKNKYGNKIWPKQGI